MEYFIGAYKKYADFSGRARRKEFWMYQLFYLIVSIALSFIDGLIGTYSSAGIGLLSTIFGFVSIIPAIALATRRLHDINKSGWWQLIEFIPLIGVIVLFIFFVLKGTDGENRYGSDPLATQTSEL
jgi:uncharacterized membrane protein YhaH (DUF805 family)